MVTRKQVCIVGAGATGITSAKACSEEGIDYVIYEMHTDFGGLWRFREEDLNGLGSVAAATIINSSKELSAFSDFPPPPEVPSYMHNTKMLEYIASYARFVGCLDKIKYEHKIVSVERAASFDKDGKWLVKIEDMKTKKVFEEIFDGVMVCTGHHVTPLWPTFPGQEKFKGKIIHTHSYKRPLEFVNKRVVVVGIGNSGGDVAVELSMVSPKVYLSTRRGAWIVHRVGIGGRPFDSLLLRRALNYVIGLVPYNLVNWCYETIVNQTFDHNRFNLKPKHRIFEQHVMVNDALPNRIISGTVELKGNVDHITEDGVVFEDDLNEYKCDVIIFATGYKVDFPFIDKKLVPVIDNKIDLYKYVFPPNMQPFPHTLGFIGLVQSIGALFPISEIQARWYARLLLGKNKLPDEVTMRADILERREALDRRYYGTPRNTMQVDWINYIDEIARDVGARPHVASYMLTDPVLWFHLWLGPCVTYQWRLEGPHKWAGARDAIITATDRMEAPLKTRKMTHKYDQRPDDLKKKLC